MTETQDFIARIKSFNRMYGLSAPATPTFDRDALRDRLVMFKKIITDEVNEVDDILDKLRSGDPADFAFVLDTLTMLSDWLGDMIVYSASELQRHGLPTAGILSIIMDSNDSKLGADGQPIVKDGKVQKGPNYWKPEPKIREVLEALVAANSWGVK